MRFRCKLSIGRYTLIIECWYWNSQKLHAWDVHCKRFVIPFNVYYLRLHNLTFFRNTVFLHRSRVTSIPRTVITLCASNCEDLTILTSVLNLPWLLNIILFGKVKQLHIKCGYWQNFIFAFFYYQVEELVFRWLSYHRQEPTEVSFLLQYQRWPRCKKKATRHRSKIILEV